MPPAHPAPAGPHGLARPALDDRRAGVLLHVTSLPHEHGPGDLGPAAYRFLDWLAEAGATVWQVLPLVPIHEGDRSPYNALSAMAGNPELISVERLAEDGLLGAGDLAEVASGALSRSEARGRAVRSWQERADSGERAAYQAWVDAHAYWVHDYVAYVAIRNSLRTPDLDGPPSWLDWPAALRDREPEALDAAVVDLADERERLLIEQYLFARQWAQVREHAHARGVRIFGDLPIFVSLDSADVWAHRDLFLLGEGGVPTTVTGCPPDYFAQDGQRWNNPHYDWERMASDDYHWWRQRLASQRELLDLVRIDHFRGFQAAWHIAWDSPSAAQGHWEPTPGHEVLSALSEESGPGTLVAEDLGTLTREVDDLRRAFGLPGMKILQFAFDGTADNPYLAERHEPLGVVYTGTHDNDTTMGWWHSLDEHTRWQVGQAVPDAGEPMPWAFIRWAMTSVCQLAVIPAQDLLELGSEGRMNTPGVPTGNWTWQADGRLFDPGIAGRFRALVEQYDRLPG